MKQVEITNEEKILILEIAYKFLIGRYANGLCHAISQAIKEIKNRTVFTFEVFEYFPELLVYKPKHSYDYWFQLNEEGNQKRLIILQTIIYNLRNG